MIQELKTFPNGLRMLVTKTESYSLSVVVRLAGGVEQEMKKNEGVSSILEKYLNCGTNNNPSRKSLVARIQSFGGVLSSSVNIDSIYFGIASLTDGLEESISVLSDIFFLPEFRKIDFDIIKQNCMREIATYNEDGTRICHDNLRAIMYPKSGIGKAITGRKLAIEKITREEVIEYYQAMLHPHNLIISICGNVDADFAYDLVMKEFYGKLIACHGRKLHAAKYEAEVEKRDIMQSKKLWQSRVQLGFKLSSEPSRYSSYLLGTSIMRNKLNDAFSSEDGFYGIDAHARIFQNNAFMYISFATEPEHVVEYIEKIAKFMNSFFAEGLKNDDFLMYRAQYQTQFVSRLETSRDMAKYGSKFLARKNSMFSIRTELMNFNALNQKKCFADLSQILREKVCISYVGRVIPLGKPLTAYFDEKLKV